MLLDPSDWSCFTRRRRYVRTDGRAGVPHEHRDSRVGAGAANRSTSDGSGGLAQLEHLRGELARELASLDIRAAVAGMHPFTMWRAQRSPKGIATAFCTGRCVSWLGVSPPSPCMCTWRPRSRERAARFNRLRSHLPLLLALSANSPFWQGRETGLASARTPLFQAFLGWVFARLLRLRGLREHDRPAAALRSIPRAHIPVVGCPPAAALWNDRDQGHGRPNHGV